MSKDHDLVVKMTINSNDFEKGIKNAKSQMNGFDKFTKNAGNGIKSMLGSLGKMVPAIAAAVGAFKGLEKAIRSTEQGSDAIERNMRVLKKGVDDFFLSINTGGFENFLSGLRDIRDTAIEAYDQLDALGTMKMWSGARIEQLKATIAENRAVVNSPKSSKEQIEAAKNEIELATQKIEEISKMLSGQASNAAMSVLREMSGNYALTEKQLLNVVKMFEKNNGGEGILDYAEYYKSLHSKSEYGVVNWIQNSMFGGMFPVYGNYSVFNSKEEEDTYNALIRLGAANEEVWHEYYNALKEDAAMRTQLANIVSKGNSTVKSGSGGGVTNPETVGLTDEQSIEYANRAVQYASVFAHEFDKAIEDYTPFIEAEEIYEADTEQITASVTESLNKIRLTANDTATALGYMTSIFGSLGEIMGDTSGTKAFLASMAAVASGAQQMIQVYTSLASIKTVEEAIAAGEGIPGPYKIIAIAGYAAAALATIATIKNAFAGSFANGGIVGGNSYSGDKLIARVNSGEMILNRSQQSALFGNGGGNVHFIIEGSQLKGVLDNYNKTNTL